MSDTPIRIGGVPEHFNLPWLTSIERGLFEHAGLAVEWIDFGGGTGAIMKSLAEGEIDMATPLTEGAITAIANGNPTKLVSMWVESPLLWGIHAAGSSTAETTADLEGQRFAISRFGSGSELMSLVLAEDLDWTLTDDSWVVVGNLDGALEALPAGDAEIFLWSMSMTQPHVTAGTFKRVGEFQTPWPSFAIAASDAFLAAAPGAAATIAQIARGEAAGLQHNDGLGQLVADRYELEIDSAMEWASQIRWTPDDTPIDMAMVSDVATRMHRLGRIDEPLTDPTKLFT